MSTKRVTQAHYTFVTKRVLLGIREHLGVAPLSLTKDASIFRLQRSAIPVD